MNASSESSERSPYTSQVETWWKRASSVARATSSSVCVPRTFVRKKRVGSIDGEAVVRLGGEVDDRVHALVADDALRQVAVGDVALHEHDPTLDILQAGTVARVREQVERDDVVVGMSIRAT